MPGEPAAKRIEKSEGFNLENFEVDWSRVSARQVDDLRWTFDVPDKQTARAIGYIVSQNPLFIQDYSRRSSELSIAILESLEDTLGTYIGEVRYEEYGEDEDSEEPTDNIRHVDLSCKDYDVTWRDILAYRTSINDILAHIENVQYLDNPQAD